jgi:hypothetical protein
MQSGESKDAIVEVDVSMPGAGIDALAARGTATLPSRRRRRRTAIDDQLRDMLESAFNVEPRPNPETLDKVASRCGLDREVGAGFMCKSHIFCVQVVRIWFCNRRQRHRRRAQAAMMRSGMDKKESLQDAGAYDSDLDAQSKIGADDGFDSDEGPSAKHAREQQHEQQAVNSDSTIVQMLNESDLFTMPVVGVFASC